MLPNPLLLERLAQQRQQEAERLGRLHLLLAPNSPPPAWRRWLVAASALVLAGTLLATLL